MKLNVFRNGLASLILITNVYAGGIGSGVGGGVNFSLINWCDDASLMVEETRDEALERLSFNADKLGALRVFYQGLINAAASAEAGEVSSMNSLTMRAIARGIQLSQLLGIPQIINGGPVEAGLAGERQIQGLLSFFDFYTLHIMKVANVADRGHFIPYYGRSNDRGVSTVKLEAELLNVALSQLEGLEIKFVKLKNDRSTYFTTVPTPQFLQSLSYLSKEVSKDLTDSVFSSALECQSKRLLKLARTVDTYLSGRSNSSMDAIRLNKFVLELNTAMSQLRSRTCHF